MFSSSEFPASAQDKIQYISLATCNGIIQCVFALDSCLNEELFFKSFDLVLDSEVILQCQWVNNSVSPYWSLPEEKHKDRFKLLQVVDVQQAVEEFISCSIDPTTDSLVQLRIFRHQDENALQDTFCLKMSHIVSDLSGLRFFLQSLAETYGALQTGQECAPSPATIRRDGWQVFSKLPPKKRWQLLQKSKKNFLKPGQWKIPFDNYNYEAPTYTTYQLGQEQIERLTEYAKERGATLNQVMLTGFLRALHRFTDAEPDSSLPIINTLDLRHYLRHGDTPKICNLSVPLVSNINFNRKDSFEDTLSGIKSDLMSQKRTMPGILPAVSMEVLFLAPFSWISWLFNQAFSQFAESGICTPLFSDGGNADISIPGHQVVYAYGLGPIAYAPAFMMTASTFRSTVTFAVGFCESSISRSNMNKIFDLMAEEFSSCAV